mgnify:CR=1 FL=1
MGIWVTEANIEKIVADNFGEVCLQRLAQDASSRSYYRATKGDSSFIIMVVHKDPLKSDEVVDGEIPKEMPFLDVQRFLKKGYIPVPDVLDFGKYDNVIVLEDLGDLTVERALQLGHEKERLYFDAIDLMARMHSYAEKNKGENCICYKRRFGDGLLRWELEHFYEYILCEWSERKPNAGHKKVLEGFFDKLVGMLTSLPYGFVHRDFQSRNLMLKDGRLYVIDFQDALWGPYIYDLVSLLRDSYVEFKKEEVLKFVDHFLDARKEVGLFCFDFETTLRHFHLQALQRKLKDAGRFVYIDRVKKNPKFLPNIPRSLMYAKEALDFLEDFKEAFEVLKELLPKYF